MWFGPFPSLASAQDWATKHRVIARFVEVIPPDTPESAWTQSRLVDPLLVDLAVLSPTSMVVSTPHIEA